MTLRVRFLALTAVALAGTQAMAASLAGSAASSGTSMASQSSGSVSESSQRSSNSSSGDERRAAAGHYTVVAVAEVPPMNGQVGRVRLTLQGEPGTTVLTLPQTTALKQGLVVGHAVRVAERSYGLEFAHAVTGEAFYLVLEDEIHQELSTRRVTS